MLAERNTTPQKALTPRPGRPHDLNRALTRTSWLPGNELRLSDWIEHGRRLGLIGRGVGWWIGDWLRYGNMKFGERYVRASRITGYDVQTLMNMVYVASAFEPEQRRPNLSFSHHAELAALPPAERERWLDLAEANRLSVRCLREELRRVRRVEAQEPEAIPAASQPEPVAEPVEPPAELPAPAAATKDGAHALRCPHCGCQIAEAEQDLPRPAVAAVASRGAA